MASERSISEDDEFNICIICSKDVTINDSIYLLCEHFTHKNCILDTIGNQTMTHCVTCHSDIKWLQCSICHDPITYESQQLKLDCQHIICRKPSCTKKYNCIICKSPIYNPKFYEIQTGLHSIHINICYTPQNNTLLGLFKKSKSYHTTCSGIVIYKFHNTIFQILLCNIVCECYCLKQFNTLHNRHILVDEYGTIYHVDIQDGYFNYKTHIICPYTKITNFDTIYELGSKLQIACNICGISNIKLNNFGCHKICITCTHNNHTSQFVCPMCYNTVKDDVLIAELT